MASKIDGIQEKEISNMEEGINIRTSQSNTSSTGFSSSTSIVAVAQKPLGGESDLANGPAPLYAKRVWLDLTALFFGRFNYFVFDTPWFHSLIAEAIGTYFIIFAGCGSVAVNKLYDGSITFPGICVTWGLIVMVMIYSVGHVSGAHFNPAVTITFTIFRRFPWKLAPLYIIAQLTGSILASGTLALLLDVTSKSYFGTLPAGSNAQSLAIEIIISFLLMFVVCGVSTDDRAIEKLGGLVIGMTIILNVFVAGPISGASMNPARSIGPAIVKQVYKGLWVYIVGPTIGTVAGAFVYNLIRFTDKPLLQLVKSGSVLRN